MSASARGAYLCALSNRTALRSLTVPSAQYGRSPAYRRIRGFSHPRKQQGKVSIIGHPPLSDSLDLSTSKPTPPRIIFGFSRFLHYSPSASQGVGPKEETRNNKSERQETSSSPENQSHGEEESKSSSDPSANSEEKQSDNEQGERKDDKKKADTPPPPHGDKSPWQVFTETLRSEFQSSKEWNESTKALSGQVQDFTQNEHLQRMRKGYTAASDAASSTTSKAFSGTGKVIGQSAAWTWDTTPVRGLRKGANVTGRAVEKMTRPLRETEAFKSVANVVDDGSSTRYGGWTEREERKRRRDAREMEEFRRTGRSQRTEPMEEDPEAGTNVTVHKDAAWKESWRQFRENSNLFSRIDSMKNTYNESENPLISTARSISDRVAGFFAENETATVIKAFRAMDPSFQLEPFLQDMREYILPEVLDAYVKGDVETLKLWLSEAQFQVYSALVRQYTTAGLESDGRILDIRNVDVMTARMLEPNEIPVFILSARTQEVHVYRSAKSGELAAGMEDKVQQVTYAIGITRLAEEVNNPETRGWRLIELQKSSRDYM